MSASRPLLRRRSSVEPSCRPADTSPSLGNKRTQTSLPSQPAPFHIGLVLRVIPPLGRRSHSTNDTGPRSRLHPPMCLPSLPPFRHAHCLQIIRGRLFSQQAAPRLHRPCNKPKPHCNRADIPRPTGSPAPSRLQHPSPLPSIRSFALPPAHYESPSRLEIHPAIRSGGRIPSRPSRHTPYPGLIPIFNPVSSAALDRIGRPLTSHRSSFSIQVRL